MDEKYLIKLASDVEQLGYTEDSEVLEDKIVSAKAAVDALEKIAAPGNGFALRLGKGLAQTAAVGLAIAGTGKAVDKAIEAIDDAKFSLKKPKIIDYAKKENPELRSVSNEKLKAWLDSAYAISPAVAKDKTLATSFLTNAATIQTVDLGTAKTLADINAKAGKNYSSAYDAIRGSSSMLPSQMMEGME